MNTTHYGSYGGRYVPEMLFGVLEELKTTFHQLKKDPAFREELRHLFMTYGGRPTPLTYAKRLTAELGGAQVYLKNEGLNHTGAHKLNHCLGQILLAKKMGKRRVIAETGAGQHGVATATVAAKFGLECVVYMGAVDVRRQRPNVFLMERLGAKVVPVTSGSQTLKDAVNEAIKDYLGSSDQTHYLLGSALGPDPYPEMNQYFQSVIGREVKRQLQAQAGVKPDVVMACVGGGSNALGVFTAFLNDPTVRLIGVEGGGTGKRLGQHATRFNGGKPGVIEGYKSYFLQTTAGNLAPTHSIAAGLDYPGISPLLAHLHDQGRVEFMSATDSEVLAAYEKLARLEGIFPALESAHAVAGAMKLVPTLPKQQHVVINISGRGDKDIFIVAKALKDASFQQFLRDEGRSYDSNGDNNNDNSQGGPHVK